jgi:hypothetical protein
MSKTTMPNYKIHIFVATIALIIFLFFFEGFNSIRNIVNYVLITVIYTLLPDIDISNSKMGKFARGLLLIFALVAFFLNEKMLTLVFLMVLLVLFFIKHRGFFHTTRCALLVAFPLVIFSVQIAILAFLMYLGHLIMDGEIKL